MYKILNAQVNRHFLVVKNNDDKFSFFTVENKMLMGTLNLVYPMLYL